jgi:hypothetical protein
MQYDESTATWRHPSIESTSEERLSAIEDELHPERVAEREAAEEKATKERARRITGSAKAALAANEAEIAKRDALLEMLPAVSQAVDEYREAIAVRQYAYREASNVGATCEPIPDSIVQISTQRVHTNDPSLRDMLDSLARLRA